MREGKLFKDKPLRDRHGRFATRERAYADRMAAENARLKLELMRCRTLLRNLITVTGRKSEENVLDLQEEAKEEILSC